MLTTVTLVPGDKILVTGIKVGAIPAAYSDAPSIPGQPAEIFPLALPEGVQLLAIAGNPVLIYQSVPSATPLISVVSSATTTVTLIQGIRLVGGAIGVALDNAAAGVVSVDALSCRFIRNEIGVSAVASGGAMLDLFVEGCVFEPTTLMFGPTGGYRTPTHGLRLHANQTSGLAIPRVDAILRSSSLLAGFPTVADSGVFGTDLVPFEMLSGFSRFIEIRAQGSTREHPENGVNRVPVAEVVLEVDGGTFRGDSKWDTFLYSSAQNVGAGIEDHTCGYVATLKNASIERFSALGVCAHSSQEARGLVDLIASTTIKETGFGAVRPSPFDTIYTGVYGHSYKGYLGITGTAFSVLDNTGHGIFLHARETRAASGLYPVGLFLGIENAGIHGNDGSGIAMMTHSLSQSIVGGTWHEDPGPGCPFLTLLDDGMDFTHLPHGQGFVNRCAISNNGEYGVHLQNLFSGPPSALSCRFVNSTIWNHPLGGVVGFSSASNEITPLYLTPVIGCTIVGNGSGQTDPFSGEISDYTVEFFEAASPDATNTYEWTEPVQMNPKTLGTRLTNTILQRKSPGQSANDFGPNLRFGSSPDLVADVDPSSNLNDERIGAAGLRGDPEIFISSFPVLVYMTSEIPQFMGPVDWASRDALQFRLASLGSGTVMNDSWGAFLFGALEVAVDFLNTTRDAYNGTLDPSAERGAFERPLE